MGGSIMIELMIQGHKIVLEESDDVFSPSLTSLCMAENIRVKEGETALDIGCGTGFFSILIAIMGGKHVVGIDKNEAAVELSKVNSRHNGVENASFTKRELSNLHINETYDIVIANVPQLPIPEFLDQDEWITDGFGGPDGTKTICDLLQVARLYVKDTGRIYVPVFHCSNPKRTIGLMDKLYNHSTIAVQERSVESIPFTNILPYLKDLCKIGECAIYRNNGQFVYQVSIHELRSKKIYN